jgi:hypothetical protein
VNRKSLKCAGCGVTALLLAGLAELSSAAVDCRAPGSSIDRRACAKAAEGPEALRRFIERTRMIYGLYYWDYMVRYERNAAARWDADNVATRQ